MKKIIKFSLLAILATAFWGCSSDNDEVVADDSDITIISETEMDNDVVDFFRTELPKYAGSASSGFFIDTNENLCYAINSMDELRKVYMGKKELPAIDFGEKTLFIGQQRMAHSSYYAKKIEIHKKAGGVVLDVYVAEPDAWYNVVSNMYFWCLCSKINSRNVEANIILHSE